MLLAHVSQEEIGGRGSLPGPEVEGIASDDGLRTLEAAMRRVTGNPKWLRKQYGSGILLWLSALACRPRRSSFIISQPFVSFWSCQENLV